MAAKVLTSTCNPTAAPVQESSVYKRFKIRCYPNLQQVELFEKWLSATRELYNAALQERRDAWKLQKISVSVYDQQKSLTEIRKFRDDIKEIPYQVTHAAIRQLDHAFEAFFRRAKAGQKAGFPRFKSEKTWNSFRFELPRCIHIKDNKIQVGKSIKILLSRYKLPNIFKIRQVTIKRECGEWYCTLNCLVPKVAMQSTGKDVGIDVGINKLAVLSDGIVYDNLHFAKEAESGIRKRCRAVSRKKRGSNRQKKARLRLAKFYRRVARKRKAYLDDVSNDIVAEYDTIYLEDLKIGEMVKDRKYGKSVNDASWGILTNMIAYKAANAGRTVVFVNPHNTSQNCSSCGKLVPKSIAERTHVCACGLTVDRDLNAARNICNLGRKLFSAEGAACVALEAGVANAFGESVSVVKEPRGPEKPIQTIELGPLTPRAEPWHELDSLRL